MADPNTPTPQQTKASPAEATAPAVSTASSSPEPDDPPAPTRQESAKLNQVFICTCCSRTFLDRSATIPIDIEYEIALYPESVPHPKYPNDPDLARTIYKPRAVDGAAKIEGREALECCPKHTKLCDSRHLSLTAAPDGKSFEITGAKHLE